jgi:hypothetical protein
MATLAALRPRLSRTPSPEQHGQALAAMRGIADRIGQARRHRYGCEPCAVAWAGQEADCWNCGNPATDSRTASALQLLLRALAPTTRKALR